MRPLLGSLRRGILGISMEETKFSRRGFADCPASVRHRLEGVGAAFVDGYHAALFDDAPEALAVALEETDPLWRGVAYEGAGMAVAMRDRLTPWRRDRTSAFLSGPGSAHTYLVHVGIGWAVARLGGRWTSFIQRFDPLLRWLILDGYGFHEGYFHKTAAIDRQIVPRRVIGYARRAFDQGLGRSLWFACGANGDSIATTIARFDAKRQSDLWSGVGLAATYAGGVDDAALIALRGAAGDHAVWLAQGAAFAAEARRRGGNPADHTEQACGIFCERTADRAADITVVARIDLDDQNRTPSYEVWRERICRHLHREAVPA